MTMMPVLLLISLLSGLSAAPNCPVTLPAAPTEHVAHGNYGNGAIWTTLTPDGRTVGQPQPDDSLRVKFPWWRLGKTLRIEGRRLDGPAPALRAAVPDGYYGDFQASALFFPTPGCWEITAKSDRSTLTFVMLVLAPR